MAVDTLSSQGRSHNDTDGGLYMVSSVGDTTGVLSDSEVPLVCKRKETVELDGIYRGVRCSL